MNRRDDTTLILEVNSDSTSIRIMRKNAKSVMKGNKIVKCPLPQFRIPLKYKYSKDRTAMSNERLSTSDFRAIDFSFNSRTVQKNVQFVHLRRKI